MEKSGGLETIRTEHVDQRSSKAAANEAEIEVVECEGRGLIEQERLLAANDVVVNDQNPGGQRGQKQEEQQCGPIE